MRFEGRLSIGAYMFLYADPQTFICNTNRACMFNNVTTGTQHLLFKYLGAEEMMKDLVDQIEDTIQKNIERFWLDN